MKSRTAYDPFGIFEIKNNKVKGDLVVILPSDPDVPEKKFKVDSKNQFDVSSKGVNGVLVVLKITSRGKEAPNLKDFEKVSNYQELKLDVKIENFNKKDKECRIVILHSNNFDPKSKEGKDIIDCVTKFNAKHPYEPYVKFDFEDCPKIAPETSGGSILVGV